MEPNSNIRQRFKIVCPVCGDLGSSSTKWPAEQHAKSHGHAAMVVDTMARRADPSDSSPERQSLFKLLEVYWGNGDGAPHLSSFRSPRSSAASLLQPEAQSMRPKRPQFSFPRVLTKDEVDALRRDAMCNSLECKRLIAERGTT